MTIDAIDSRARHSATGRRSNMLISRKPIPVNERLIFALDVPNEEKAKELVEELGDSVQFYKIGLELFMSGSYLYLLEYLHAKGKEVLVDLKFFDVPQTVASAVKSLSARGAKFATVHGPDNILSAAVAEKGTMNILAVTVLTSLGEADIRDLGFRDVSVKELVLSRARRALQIGCAGVISSGLEAEELRKDLGHNFLIVCPGIRPVANVDDQKRTVDVEDAFLNGADYIVVGRPIRDQPRPREAAEKIQARIAKVFARASREQSAIA